MVAFASGGIPEVVANGETGVLIENLTPEALAEGIGRLISLPACELRRISANAREEWRRKYTLERYQSQMLGIIARAADGKAAR